MKARLVKIGLAVGVVIFLLLSGLGAFLRRSSPTVYVLNGLPTEVSVRFDSLAPVTVPPGARTSLELPTGWASVEVRRAQQVLATEKILIPTGEDFVGYNVLGAAPLYLNRAHYSATPSKDAPLDYQVLAGRTFVTVSSVDAVFRDLPSSISTKQRSGEEIRTQVATADDGRWPTTVRMLFGLKRFEQAAALLRKLVEFEDDALPALMAAYEHGPGGLGTSIAVLKELVRERPDWYEAHRMLQWGLRSVEGVEAARAFYRARLDANPGSALEQLLLARVDDNAAAEAALRKLLRDNPDDVRVLRFLAVVLARSERWAETADLLSRAPRDDPDAQPYFDLTLRALVGSGRLDEAIKLVESSLGPEPDDDSLVAAALALRVAHQPEKAAELIDHHQGKAREGTPLRLLAGLESRKTDKEGPAASIFRAALRGPAEAWDAIGKDNESALGQFSDELLLLLAAEFHRMGGTGRAEALLAQSRHTMPPSVVWAYVERGEEGADIQRSEPQVRAALYLARALAVEASGKSGAPLRARARKADVLNGFVAQAAAHWPPGVPPPNEEAPITFIRVDTARAEAAK